MPGAEVRAETGEHVSVIALESESRRFAEAILDTMRQPLLVLNGDLRVELANRAVFRVFEVTAAETTGRLIYELGNGQWDIRELRALLQEILPSSGVVEEFRVDHHFEQIGRRVMMLNARRMVNAERTDAILLSIDDITGSEHARWLLEAEKEYAEKIVDASRDALLILGWDLRVRTANETFYDTFRVDRAATEGKLVYELGNGQWNIPKLRDLLENVLPDNEAFDDFEVEHDFGDLGRRIMVLNARRVDHTQLILLAIEDQTDARRADRALRESEARLSSLMQHAPIGIGLIDPQRHWIMQNPVLERMWVGLSTSRDANRAVWSPETEESDPASAIVARALRGEVTAPGVDFRTVVEGEESWIRISAAPVEGARQVEHAVVIVEDVTESKRAEEEREILLGELNHRVKNLFGVIRSLVTQGDGGADVEQYKTTLKGRLDALVRAHSLATESSWRSIDLVSLAVRILQPYALDRADAINVMGEPLPLEARHALMLSLILHELATNAVKYGALSRPEGRVRLAWSSFRDDGADQVELVWEESGGPAVRQPAREGFGTKLIKRVFAYDLQGDTRFEFRPEGIRVTARFPAS